MTPQSRLLFHRAREEAENLGHAHIELEHLLLALLKFDPSVALGALSALLLRPEGWRETLEPLYPPPPVAGVMSRLICGPHTVSSSAAVRAVMQRFREATTGSERSGEANDAALEGALLLRLILESPDLTAVALPEVDRQRWLQAIAA